MGKLKYLLWLIVIPACINSKVSNEKKLKLQASRNSYFEKGKYYYDNYPAETPLERWDTAAQYFRKYLGNDTIKYNPLTNNEQLAFSWLSQIYYYQQDFEQLNSLCKIVMQFYPKYYVIINSIWNNFDSTSRYYHNQEFNQKYSMHFKKMLQLDNKGEYDRQKEILEKVFDRDQKFRRMLFDGTAKDSMEIVRLNDSVGINDSMNLQIVKAIIDQYGWLSPDEVGIKANQAMFLVIQHSDSAVLLNYYPLIEQAYKDGKVTKADFCLFTDRVSLHKYGYQIYGTQYKRDNKTGKEYLLPIKDSLNVNDRRREMGLDILKQQ